MRVRVAGCEGGLGEGEGGWVRVRVAGCEGEGGWV